MQLLPFQGLQATCCCCCFSKEADKKPQSFLPSFCLIPVFIVLQAQGCTIQNVPQPIQVFLDSSLSALLLPLWMDQQHSDKFAFYFAEQQPVSCSLCRPCSLCQLQTRSHCFASSWIVPPPLGMCTQLELTVSSCGHTVLKLLESVAPKAGLSLELETRLCTK